MGQPQPGRRRRESIADHLESARRALARQCPVEIEGTRELVRDLIRNGLIGPTYEVDKRSGRGRGRRFKPHDYRDLIEILHLRADGHVHRRRWLIWLWLRGRPFPLDRIRVALRAEIEAHTRTLLAQMNPTGRLTEDFLKKYRRNVRGKARPSPFPDLGKLDEVIATLMMRPRDAGKVNIDLDAFAKLAAETLGIDEAAMRQGMDDFGPTSGKDVATATAAFAELIPDGAMKTLFKHAVEFAPMAVQSVDSMAGIVDDGTGHSTLLPALDAASDDALLAARREVRLLRTGLLEHHLRRTAMTLAADDAAVLGLAADWARTQRLLHRGNPAYAAYLFCIQVKANGAPIPIPARPAVDVNAFLRRWRDG